MDIPPTTAGTVPHAVHDVEPASLSAPPPVPWRTRLRRLLLSTAPATWACLDGVLVAFATSTAQCLLLATSSQFDWMANPWLVTTCFCAAVICSGLVFGLYERTTLFLRSAIILRSVLTLGLGTVLAFACLSVFFYAAGSRWVGLSVALTYLAVALPLRLFAHEVITTSRVRLLCVGAEESIRQLVRMLSQGQEHYQIIGRVEVPVGAQRLVANRQPVSYRPRFRSEAELQFDEACPSLGDIDDLDDIFAEQTIDEIIVGSEVTANSVVGRAAATCLENRCRVTDQATFVEKLLGEVPAESITPEWFLKADVQNHGSYESAKRFLDVIVSAFGLLITLPFLPLIVLIIRLDSPGPAIYRQIRVGWYGRYFHMYKFRTMRTDAEADGVRWADKNDNRVTRIGRFLRRTRLDELPQLFNILRGDMSLVGPRPERPEFVHNLEQLLPHYRLRHLVRPGLSGWAQIHYHYGASVADAHRKLCYDLYYLKHRSLDLDLAVLMRTFGTFLLGAR